MKIQHVPILILLLLTLSACSVTQHHPLLVADTQTNAALTTSNSTSVSSDMILRMNYCSELFMGEGIDVTSWGKDEGLTENYEVYRKAYELCQKPTAGRHEPFPAPNLGLALSGGGIRSGSFAIGVLKALNEIQMPHGESLLRQVDAISSVSGGGYAAYWYLMQNYYLDPVKAEEHKEIKSDDIYQVHEDIFRTRSNIGIFGGTKYQDHLATTSDLIHAYDNPLSNPFEDLWYTAGQLLSLPFHWVTNGIMDWRFNISVVPLAYRQGIERTYGLVTRSCYNPMLDKCQEASCKYHNARRGYFAWFNDEAQADPVSFSNYREFLRARNKRIHDHNTHSATDDYIHPLPIPIINTTLGLHTKKFEKLHEAVYTFTPISYGSDLGGYIDDADISAEVSLAKAYAISGAAVDGNARESGKIGDFSLWALNGNLGYRYPNHNQNINSLTFNLNRAFHYLLPIGLYHLHDYFTPEAYKAFYRISDGGHSENLGFYSLIKRATRHVIVVDAELDGQYQFDGLHRLKENLCREMSLETRIDLNNIGYYYKDKRNTVPVFSGKISGLKYPDSSSRDIDFIYLKLALDQDLYEIVHCNALTACSTTEQIRQHDPRLPDKLPLPCSVVDYIRNEKPGKKNRFPHNSTADISYDEAQYQAFRDFGYYLTMTKLRAKLLEVGWLDKLELFRTSRLNFFNGLIKDAKTAINKTP